MGKLLLLKKGSALAAAAAVVLAGTAGCGETTNTEIVRYKTQDSEARMVEAGEFENIRSQVAAPERSRTLRASGSRGWKQGRLSRQIMTLSIRRSCITPGHGQEDTIRKPESLP